MVQFLFEDETNYTTMYTQQLQKYSSQKYSILKTTENKNSVIL